MPDSEVLHTFASERMGRSMTVLFASGIEGTSEMLRVFGPDVEVATSTFAFEKALESRVFDAIFISVALPDAFGLVTLVRQRSPRVPIVCISIGSRARSRLSQGTVVGLHAAATCAGARGYVDFLAHDDDESIRSAVAVLVR